MQENVGEDLDSLSNEQLRKGFRSVEEVRLDLKNLDSTFTSASRLVASTAREQKGIYRRAASAGQDDSVTRLVKERGVHCKAATELEYIHNYYLRCSAPTAQSPSHLFHDAYCPPYRQFSDR